ncbi:hypothetical protein U1701_10970 [Sphingomonas sp. PB2P19]|uniref:hypothetical protein n=1 Tax=Sphingomonas rhamnosi TaxID=3096156 RepID=UPI002FC8FDF7
MRYSTSVMMVAASALLCASAAAQEASKAEVPPAKEKKTCRSLMPTGSIMATRVCNTKDAWKRFDDYTAEGADQFRNTYRMTTTGQKPS